MEGTKYRSYIGTHFDIAFGDALRGESWLENLFKFSKAQYIAG